MKFQSQIITAGSGSIGGTTYGHNKGGMYMRGRGTPTNPNSPRQQATRGQFAAFAAAWTGLLDQSERDLWNAYAQTHTVKGPFGEDLYINGISWYIMFNSRLTDAGFASKTVPPAFPAPGPLVSFEADISAITTVDFSYSPALTGVQALQAWMTLPGSQGQTPNFRQARLVGYSPLAQVSPWQATMPFGVTVDAQCTFYARVMNDAGQVSTLSVATDIADYGA
ncbi:hypothetical protein ES703_51433 [subsurface metagenome]